MQVTRLFITQFSLLIYYFHLFWSKYFSWCTFRYKHKDITCSIALWISFGLSAWAWGRHDSASSAAARTILRSQPREALSAMLTASGGVRCPSQVSMRKEIAGAPISIAWPVLMYTYLSHSNKTNTTITITSNSYRNQRRALGIATVLRDGQSGTWIPVGQEIFLFLKLSRLAVGTTQPPIHFILWFFPGGKAASAWS